MKTVSNLSADEPDRRTRPEPVFGWRFVTPVLLASTLNPVNSSIIATALAPIGHHFHVAAGSTAVLVAALYLASSIAQPTMGKLAAEFGARRIYFAGITIALIGGLIGGLANSMALLIVARVVIGVGTSAGYPAAMVLIRTRAEQAGIAAPGSVLGGLSIASQVTVALGLPVGGVLVGALGWRVTFLVNVPIVLVAYVMAWNGLPKDPPVTGRRSARQIARAVDPLGILLFGGAMSTLLVFLLSLQHPRYPAIPIFVVLIVAMVVWERRAGAPLINVRLLASNLALTRTYLRQAGTYVGNYCLVYGVTQWVQDGKGMSATLAGLVMLPMSGVSAIVSKPVASRNLVRVPLVVGSLIGVAVAIALRFMTIDTATVLIVIAMLAYGFTLSLSAVGNQGALYAQSPPREAGTAAGLLRSFTYTGAILSSSIIDIAYAHGVTDRGLHTMADVLIGASVVVVLLTVLDRRLPARIDRH